MAISLTSEAAEHVSRQLANHHSEEVNGETAAHLPSSVGSEK